MSLRRPLVNAYLKYVEKPRLARVENPDKIRKALEFQARWMFRAPRGTQMQWQVLETHQRRVDALEVVPQTLRSEGVLLYIHGGAFIFGSPRTHAAMVAHIGKRLSARAVLPQYRLAPEHPFPAAVDDVRAAWDGLLGQGVDPNHIIIGGDSAGGALALGLLGELCKEGGALPGGVFGLSPLTDLTQSGDSFHKNAKCDVLLSADRGADMRRMYLGAHPPQDPRVSPLLADFTHAPGVWMTVGDTEILYDDALRMAAHLRRYDADVTLVQKRDLPHVWPLLKDILPEGHDTLEEIATWIRQQPGWPDGN